MFSFQIEKRTIKENIIRVESFCRPTVRPRYLLIMIRLIIFEGFKNTDDSWESLPQYFRLSFLDSFSFSCALLMAAQFRAFVTVFKQNIFSLQLQMHHLESRIDSRIFFHLWESRMLR